MFFDNSRWEERREAKESDFSYSTAQTTDGYPGQGHGNAGRIGDDEVAAGLKDYDQEVTQSENLYSLSKTFLGSVKKPSWHVVLLSFPVP